MSGLSKRDTQLLQAAADGLSAEEIGDKFGLPPAECLLHIKNLLKQRDVWTETERRQLLLVDLYRLKNMIVEQNPSYMDDKQASTLLKTVSTISVIMEKMGTLTEEEMNKISQAHARTMVMLIVEAWKGAQKYLETEYPEVSTREVEKVLHEHLRIAMTKADIDDE